MSRNQIAIDRETHNFEPEAKFENGPLLFLIKIIDRLSGRVFWNRREHFQHEHRILTERSVENGDCGPVPPGLVMSAPIRVTVETRD